MSLVAMPLLLVAGSANGQPLSEAERNAVGNALGEALGIMSGKVKSDSKFSICMRMFPDGPPANAAQDVTWQSCKDVLPQRGNRHAALISGRRQPLTTNQRAQVANALADALSVMSGKRSSDSKYSSCASLFPPGDRPPANAASSSTWQACRSVLATSLAQRAVRILRQQHPLTQDERSEVAVALTTALKAVDGKGGARDLWSTCDAMFPDHKRPAEMPASDVTWAACHGQFGVAAASLISVGKHRE